MIQPPVSARSWQAAVAATQLRGRAGKRLMRHPEAWLSFVAGLGWLIVVVHQVVAAVAGDAVALHRSHVDAGNVHLGLATELLVWAAMIAIMLPLIGPNVRFVAMRSQQSRRVRATVDVVVGWLALWALAAAVLADLVLLGDWLVGREVVVVGFTVVAVAWQLSALKRRSVARCDRVFAPPLDPAGAARACREFGILLGSDCVGSCWALMALVAAANHSLLAVVPGFWVLWSERRRRAHHDPRPAQAVRVIVCTGLVLVTVGLG